VQAAQLREARSMIVTPLFLRADQAEPSPALREKNCAP
jgi:hypothetical protein